MQPHNNIQEDLKKNKPTLLPAIINSIIAFIGLASLIVIKILFHEPNTLLFIAFVILLCFFPIAGWYNSFYSRKEKSKMLNSFEKETELIVDFLTNCKKMYKISEDNTKIDISFTNTLTDDINESFTYNEENSSVGYLDHTMAFMSIGVGFIGLVIDPNTLEVKNINGLLPRSIWLKKRLNIPSSHMGRLSIKDTNVDIRAKTYIQTMKNAETFYDKDKGYICVGEYKHNALNEYVEFSSGAIAGLRDGKLISLWIKVVPNLSIY